MKRIPVLILALTLAGCSTFRKSAPVAPSSATQSASASVISSFNARLSAISAWLGGVQDMADLSDKKPELTAFLSPAKVLAGAPDPKVAAAVKAAEPAVLKGDTTATDAATVKATAQVSESDKQLAALQAAFEKDRAAQAAFLKQHDAEWQAKLDKANSVVWNLIAGALILVGVVTTAAGFAVRALALQIPMFGPKVSQAISVLGATLAVGGICLYAIGPYLKILAITLGVAALLGLVAAILCYANHQHHVCSSPSSPSSPALLPAAT